MSRHVVLHTDGTITFEPGNLTVSNTPRTDAAAIRCACSSYVVPSEFAQQLERENFELLQKMQQLERENAALRAVIDAAIDLLEYSHHGATERWESYDEKLYALKSAIDAARKEAQP